MLLNCDDTTSEGEFQSEVIKLFESQGYKCYHTHDSRKSQAGFPDLVLVNKEKGRLVIAELKSKKGKCSDAQADWLEALDAVRVISVHVWRPGVDNDKIMEVLQR